MRDTIEEARPDHDAELDICGRVYLFRRGHELLRRLEQRLGALIPLAQRVERFAITQAEMAMIYEEIVKGDESRPSRLSIERWIWDEGTPKLAASLAKVLYELPIGNRTLRLMEEQKRITAAEQRVEADAARPTSPPDHGPADRLRSLATELARTFETAA